jgi:hypothetical protein
MILTHVISKNDPCQEDTFTIAYRWSLPCGAE